jgi:hypothetical protein
MRQYLTVSQLVKKYPWPSASSIRHLIFHAERNGFTRVMRRIGRRVLIDEQEFLRWINENGVAKQTK